jgi:hypothetical protein
MPSHYFRPKKDLKIYQKYEHYKIDAGPSKDGTFMKLKVKFGSD